MAITINGAGTITGISAGGYPDGSVTDADLASSLDLSGHTVTLPSGTGGKILQVVQSTKTDTGSMSGTTYTDLGLSVSITPLLATSKVLIFCFASVSATSAYDAKLRLVRDSTAILIGDAAGSRPQATTSFTADWGSGGYSTTPATIVFLDSPSTTSATTYKLQARNYTTDSVFINRGPTDTNSANYESRTASSIIAMEVAA